MNRSSNGERWDNISSGFAVPDTIMPFSVGVSLLKYLRLKNVCVIILIRYYPRKVAI